MPIFVGMISTAVFKSSLMLLIICFFSFAAKKEIFGLLKEDERRIEKERRVEVLRSFLSISLERKSEEGPEDGIFKAENKAERWEESKGKSIFEMLRIRSSSFRCEKNKEFSKDWIILSSYATSDEANL